MSCSQIIDAAQEAVQASAMPPSHEVQSVVGHASSASLGGARFPCGSFECRKARLDQLCRFAALCAERVYMRNFLSDYAHDEGSDQARLKEEFHNDLMLLSHAEPLIDSGIIVIVSPPTHVCLDCFAEIMGQGILSHKAAMRVLKGLERDYLAKTRLKIGSLAQSYWIDIEGPEPFIPHQGRNLVLKECPEPIASKPRLCARLRRVGELTLSPTMQKRLSVHTQLAVESWTTGLFQLSMARFLGAAFLTDNELDLMVLRALTNDPEIERGNAIASRHLPCLVPLLEDLDLKKVLKVREREKESFVKFRAAHARAAREFFSSRTPFSPSSARELYNDLIAPRLADLDQRVKSAKRDLGDNARRSALSALGALTFGVFAGIIPSDLVAVAKAVGFTKFASDLLRHVMCLGDAEKTVRNDDFFFLWKVRRRAGKR
jgi:hypothetical protein